MHINEISWNMAQCHNVRMVSSLCESVVQELLLCIWLLCWMSPCFEGSIQGVALTRFTHSDTQRNRGRQKSGLLKNWEHINWHYIDQNIRWHTVCKCHSLYLSLLVCLIEEIAQCWCFQEAPFLPPSAFYQSKLASTLWQTCTYQEVASVSLYTD